jgi:hypothetical protein
MSNIWPEPDVNKYSKQMERNMAEEGEMEEYSIEWFKWIYINNNKWLGTQAKELLKHYIQLEDENEKLRELIAECGACFGLTADKYTDHEQMMHKCDTLKMERNNG